MMEKMKRKNDLIFENDVNKDYKLGFKIKKRGGLKYEFFKEKRWI